MINFVSYLSLLLIYSGTSWSSSSVLSTPWIITIDVEPKNSSFISCIGVLTSETEVFAIPECINQLPADSQFVLRGDYRSGYQAHQQTRLIKFVGPSYNVDRIVVNPFVLNNHVQTLQIDPVEMCISTALSFSDTYAFLKDDFKQYSVTKLNFSNTEAVCNELNTRNRLHACTRLSDDDCRLLSEGGGNVLAIKFDGSFKLAGFKIFHDCERKVAVYTKICRIF